MIIELLSVNAANNEKIFSIMLFLFLLPAAPMGVWRIQPSRTSCFLCFCLYLVGVNKCCTCEMQLPLSAA
jgi:hypothetical protein